MVVTHDSRVFEFGDRIAHMEDGRIERVEIGHGRLVGAVEKRLKV